MKDRETSSVRVRILEGTHLVLLITYTMFAVILMGEVLLMGWETWSVLLVLASIAAVWSLHITGRFSPDLRLWIYAVLMMSIFFFYGVHETSTYDLVGVALLLILIFSMTMTPGLIHLVMFTYYVTMIYDLIRLGMQGAVWDALTVSRTFLHFFVVLAAGGVAKFIIERWLEVYRDNDARILELTEVNHRTENFLTNVSHEIRTPINAVLGLSGILLKREHNEALQKDLQAVQEAGHRVSEQINDILDFTEIDMGSLVVNRENYMITSLVNDFLTDWGTRHRGLELIVDLDASVPSVLVGDSSKIKKILFHLVSNAVKFTRNGCVYISIGVFRKSYGANLFLEVRDTGRGMEQEEIEKIYQQFYQSNSGRNRQAGGLGLGLSIVYGFVRAMGGFLSIESAPGSGTRIRVSIPQEISNSEPCMSIENKERLCLAIYARLDRFEVSRVREYYNEMLTHIVNSLETPIHLVSSKKELLNLQKTYSLTHLFVGRSEYEEDREYLEALTDQLALIILTDEVFELRPGSRARLLLKPFYGLPLTGLLNSGTGKGFFLQEKAQLHCPGVRALVVDDEPMNLMVAEGIFRDYGMEVTTAESGGRALELCKQETFDLVFMDHMMPEMDGVECMHHLRAMKGDKGKDMIIIALTANAVSSARDMFLSEGFDGFVSKPIELAELERTLKHLLPESAITYEYDAGVDISLSNQESAQADPLDLLFRCGIDIHTGLTYCRNDRQFYRTLVSKYASDGEGKAKALSSCYAKEDWKGYQILIHALKSNSRMIGALELSDKARLLEEAAKEGRTGFIRTEHEPFLEAFRSLTDSASALLSPSRNGGEGSAEVCEISREELLEALREVAACLQTFEEGRAEELLNSLSQKTFRGKALSGALSEILSMASDFELEGALEKTGSLIETLEKEKDS